jgi:hypothetical protein
VSVLFIIRIHRIDDLGADSGIPWLTVYSVRCLNVAILCELERRVLDLGYVMAEEMYAHPFFMWSGACVRLYIYDM